MATRKESEESCDELLLTYLQEAQSLIHKCRQYQHIKGMHKLEKKCRAELKYLQSLRRKADFIHESQLKSSNLCHFAGILHAMQVLPGVVSMVMAVHSPNRTTSLHVDIVAGQGQMWVKVIARKAQALHLIWAGEGQFGEHNLIKHSEDYITCAKSNPVNFCPPTVHFAFYNQVTFPMAEALEERGVVVWGERVTVDPNIETQLKALNAVYLDSDEGSQDLSGEEASEDLSGDKASEDLSGDEASEDLSGDEASEDLSGDEASEDLSGDEASEDLSGDEASEDLSGDEASEDLSGEAREDSLTDDDQPSVTNPDMCASFAANCDVYGLDSKLPVSGSELPGSDKELPVSHCKLPVSGSELPVADKELPGSESKLPLLEDNLPGIKSTLLFSESELAILETNLLVTNKGLPVRNNKVAVLRNDSTIQENIDNSLTTEGRLSQQSTIQSKDLKTDNVECTQISPNLKMSSGNISQTKTDVLSEPNCRNVRKKKNSKHLNKISETDRGNQVTSVGLKQSYCTISKTTESDLPWREMLTEGVSEETHNLFTSCLLISVPQYDVSKMLRFTESGSTDQSVHSAKVNLDITTLITLVSAVTHGGCHFIFPEKILTLQAKDEIENPALPPLQRFLKGKELYVCQSAWDDFETILKTLGGPEERRRAKLLLQKVKVIPDQPSKRAQDLPDTGKIRQRTKVIFGTGDALGAVTTTANMGFVRAAEHQGVSFAVYSHSSRALTESKEKNATSLNDTGTSNTERKC